MTTASTEKNPSTGLTVEVFGPTVEFLTTESGFSVLKGVVPPGVFVPMHSHPDVEDFIVIAGEMQCLKQEPESHEWITAKVGDYIHVPGNARHAWRNASNEPAILLIITTNKMEQFFRESGRSIDGTLQLPTPEELGKFAAISAKYGYWIATPEENAAVGIHFSF
ncbi:cupin [Ktedonobacter sp. SOSP1-85]|uniref:cupin domain-containing protein n=1 Tax=Ktedonobacter sp. SOSP1-85 TaxID=2778367 RepID=UPI001914FE67|nr:cupin domain-containing protein [Ktedonobacter sp. SOSP1-85]GHO72429.1 cupin [Ktedonobacter sp. SOSP1-85]